MKRKFQIGGDVNLRYNRDENGSYIYFIRDGLGHIKIGVASNIKKRIRSLQTANPMQLEYFMECM